MGPKSVLLHARRLRSERGQTSAEYVGILVVAVAIVLVLLNAGIGDRLAAVLKEQIALMATDQESGGSASGGAPGVGSSDGGSGPRSPTNGSPLRAGPRGAAADAAEGQPSPDADGDGLADGEDPVPGADDADRDGLSDGEEVALGSNARASDTDGDGVADRQEYEQGTDPARGVAPLTKENAQRPWERVGMSEEKWRELEAAVIAEATPGGVEGFLLGNPYWGVNLDEKGQLELMEVQESSVGGGLVKGLVRVLGGSGGRSIGRAASRISPTLARPLARLGVLRGGLRVPRPPVPPVRPGTALGALDDLGRPTGAAANITRRTLGTGSRATGTPPGFAGKAAGHARGHLIGRQLGGSGSDARNVVTLFQRPANSPVMRGFENRVRAAVEAGETVRYTVVPIYRGTEAIPRAVTLTARGSRGFRLGVSVLNKGG